MAKIVRSCSKTLLRAVTHGYYSDASYGTATPRMITRAHLFFVAVQPWFLSRTHFIPQITPMPRRKGRSSGALHGAIAKVRQDTPSAHPGKYYAIQRGRDGFSGVVTTWDECTLYVTGVKGAVFKSFKTYEEANAFASRFGRNPAAASFSISSVPRTAANAAPSHGANTGDQTATSSVETVSYDLPVAADPPPDAPDRVVVYTDGACSRNGRVGSKAGVGVFFAEESPYNVSEPLKGLATNQRAEMKAALEAMSIVLEHGLVAHGGTIELHTDSAYTKKGVEEWTQKWKRNNWQTVQRTDVKNKDLWVAIDSVKTALRQKGIQVSMRWVKGHSGVPGNEAADRLAVAGMSRYSF